ncbi:MAG TPA: hypothetical protein VGN34_17195 [Ktedonobacteraceae bacterium]|jgi:hypothetical protein
MNQQSPLVVGVFEQAAEARRALDELRTLGFGHDDLGLALREGGAPITNLVQDLMLLGLPQEQAEFYYQAVQSGKAVASIRAQTRAQEVHDLLQRSGAYDYSSATSEDTAKSHSQKNQDQDV